MSTKELNKTLVGLLKRLPNDSLKFNASFKDTQLTKYSTLKTTLNEKQLKSQIQSLNHILDNRYQKLYPISEKLTKPQGYSDYYERLLSNINGENKESMFSAMRTVVFGK